MFLLSFQSNSFKLFFHYQTHLLISSDSFIYLFRAIHEFLVCIYIVQINKFWLLAASIRKLFNFLVLFKFHSNLHLGCCNFSIYGRCHRLNFRLLIKSHRCGILSIKTSYMLISFILMHQISSLIQFLLFLLNYIQHIFRLLTIPIISIILTNINKEWFSRFSINQMLMID